MTTYEEIYEHLDGQVGAAFDDALPLSVEFDPAAERIIRELGDAPMNVRNALRKFIRREARENLLPAVKRGTPRSSRQKQHLQDTVRMSVSGTEAKVTIGSSSLPYAVYLNARTGFFDRAIRDYAPGFNRRVSLRARNIISDILAF